MTEIAPARLNITVTVFDQLIDTTVILSANKAT